MVGALRLEHSGKWQRVAKAGAPQSMGGGRPLPTATLQRPARPMCCPPFGVSMWVSLLVSTLGM